MKLRVLVYCVFLLILTGCFGKKNVVTKKKNTGLVLKEDKPVKLPSIDENKHIEKLEEEKTNLNSKVLDYIEKYAAIAVKEMHEHQIPASITLAQGILESGNGTSELARKSNNHFGIKCHTQWQGERVYHDDDEAQECFRKYQYVETSYHDHSAFLTQRQRYAFLFDYGIRDYKNWARGLKKAGYATDKKYPDKLITIIETYKLYEFDKVKKKDFKYTETTKKEEESTSVTSFYLVEKGDTLYSISRKFNVSVATLKELNNLKDNTISIGQELIIK